MLLLHVLMMEGAEFGAVGLQLDSPLHVSISDIRLILYLINKKRGMLFIHLKILDIPTSSLYFFSLYQSFHSFYFLLQFSFLSSPSECPKYLPTQ